MTTWSLIWSGLRARTIAATGWIGQQVASVRGLVRLGVLAALAVAAVELASHWAPPFYPFLTYGQIYVDSPEVYTRQRLVNDRYDQDHWLRTQLERLDEATLIASRIRRKQALKVEEAGGADEPPANGEPAPPGIGIQQELSALHAMEVKSGLRAILRQAILENQLDDRHDLSGNSIYGFKFDTTVVPGRNTRSPAFIRIRTKIDHPNRAETGQLLNEGDYLLAGVYPNDENRHVIVKQRKYEELYLNWIRDIQKRLDRYTAALGPLRVRSADTQPQACNPGTPGTTPARPSAAMQRAFEILDIVLAIPATEVSYRLPGIKEAGFSGNTQAANEAVRLKLNEPWGNHYSIEVYFDEQCNPQFEVTGLASELFFLRKLSADVLNEDSGAWELDEFQQPIGRHLPLFDIDSPEDSAHCKPGTGPETEAQCQPKWIYRVSTKYFEDITSMEQFRELSGRYKLRRAPWSFLQRLVEEADKQCPDGPTDTVACPEVLIPVPTGQLNLVKSLLQQDSYSYAVLPKSEAIGQLAEEAKDIIAGGASDQLSLRAAVQQSLSESRTKLTMVGFSDSRKARDGSIDFGWIFDVTDTGQPIQRSQMALISVPAWEDQILFEVTPGWLNRDGGERADPPYELTVALPPDFEAFETIIFGRSNDARRQPVIHEAYLDRRTETDLTFKSCLDNSLLIPGRRLWRSTTVTAGAYQADKITVLPNMDGIIATFAPFDKDAEMAEDDRPLPVRVWTSEGMVETVHRIRIAPCASAN